MARWKDNNDGTITDTTTNLVWLKDASWGGQHALWSSERNSTPAHDRASSLKHGVGELKDGSTEGDWRLPTKNKLERVASGDEAVWEEEMRAFTGIQSSPYWSSTTNADYPEGAWDVELNVGDANDDKRNDFNVWPVRSGQ